MAGNYKVVLVGDVEVGKTTLFNRFKEGKFVESGEERQTRQQAEWKKTWEYEGEQLTVRKTILKAILLLYRTPLLCLHT